MSRTPKRTRASLSLTQLEGRELPAGLLTADRTWLAVGTDAGVPAQVRVYDNAGHVVRDIQPYGPSFTGGVRVAVGDVTGDGVADVVTAPGPGMPTIIKVFDGNSGADVRDIAAFEETFVGGCFVSVGDIDKDGIADIAVSPDMNGGPRVRVLNGQSGSSLADFLAIDDPNFRGGVRTTLGDLNGDGQLDLVVSAGFGGGPRIAGFDGASLRHGSGPHHLFHDFFAFEETLRNGVYLSAGDLTGDACAELIAGAGPGGGPRVIAIDGKQLTGAIGGAAPRVLDFMAGNTSDRSGVRVGTTLGASGEALLVTAQGPEAMGMSRSTTAIGNSSGPWTSQVRMRKAALSPHSPQRT